MTFALTSLFDAVEGGVAIVDDDHVDPVSRTTHESAASFLR